MIIEEKAILEEGNFQYYKEKLISYTAKIPISEEYKNLICAEDFFEDNPSFYSYYPKLFSSAFPGLNSENIDLLCIAGFFYYRSTLFLDRIIDDKTTAGLFLALICQEEATKIMTNICGLYSSYWNSWNSRRKEYLKAIKIEKEFAGTTKKISLDEYSKLADYKSAFGKSAIDALYHLSEEKNDEIFAGLIQSHNYFSVAFQINDDIIDFKEDFEKGQFNIAINSIHNSNGDSPSISELNKLFYIRGNAKNLFKTAIEYLDKSLEEVKHINVPLWTTEIQQLKRKYQFAIIEIDNYLKRLNSEIRLSNEIFSRTSIADSIVASIKFIKDSQNEDGSWNEYINQGGISESWSTAFIAQKLSQTYLKGELAQNIEKAIHFLQKSKHDPIWGYNSTWIGDADTTNFVFLAFYSNGISIDDNAFREWSLFHNKEKGFSTYRDANHLLYALSDKEISNVDAWISGHQCVSAVSFYFLTISKRSSKTHEDLDRFFSKNLKNDTITSYWWTSNIYTLYYLAKSYHFMGKTSSLKIISKKISESQDIGGSFSDKYGPNLFMTGLAIEILMLQYSTYKVQIENSISFLIKNQYSDGSWENSHALQVPNPVGKERNILYPVRTHGTSVRAVEFNRLFTTVSILEALASYEQRITST